MEGKNKITELIANGTITVQDLAEANDLIERAKFISEAIEACKKNLVFPVGEDTIKCFDQWSGDSNLFGWCTHDGIFSLNTNCGGNHLVGTCNILDFNDVFINLETEMATGLRNFLEEQIEKAKNNVAD